MTMTMTPTMLLVLLLTATPLCRACIGAGCVWDRVEERFYWFSDRVGWEADNVADAGGPAVYCQSLGMFVTPPGSELWTRAEEVARAEDSVGPPTSPSFHHKRSSQGGRVICHEVKWDEWD